VSASNEDEELLRAMVLSIPTNYMPENEVAIVIDRIVHYLERQHSSASVARAVPLRLHFRESGNCGAELRILVGLEERGFRVRELVLMDHAYTDASEDGIEVPRDFLEAWSKLRQADYTILTSYPELTIHALNTPSDGSLMLAIGVHVQWQTFGDLTGPDGWYIGFKKWNSDADNVRMTWYDAMARLADLGLAYPHLFEAFSSGSTFGQFTVREVSYREEGDEKRAAHLDYMIDYERRFSPHATKKFLQMELERDWLIKRGGRSKGRRSVKMPPRITRRKTKRRAKRR